MALTDSAGLLFTIKGDSSGAVKSIEEFKKELDGIEKKSKGSATGLEALAASSGLSASQFFNLKIGALAAVAGVTAVAAVATTTALALFQLSKAAAEYGSAIFDASEKTGLTATTLSAMKFAADQSGSSLEQVTAGAARFARVIGEAANGSEQAQEKLKRLGVTSTDLDTALSQALATIVKVPPGALQMAAAMDAFGRSGADLLPFIKSFDGDLVKLTAEAKRLGVTIDDEAARAADEFGDQLDTLNAQLAGIGRTIGFTFMPVFQDMAKAISEFLARNQGEIANWGQNFARTLQGLVLMFGDIKFAAESYGVTLKSLIDLHLQLDPLARHVAALGEAARRRAAPTLDTQGGTDFELDPVTNTLRPRTRATTPPDVPAPRVRTGAAGGGGRDRSAELAARLAERDLIAQIRIETENLRTIQEQGVTVYEEIRKKLGEGASIVSFIKETNDHTANWQDNLRRSLALIEALENRAQDAAATEHERALLRQQQEKRRQELESTGAKEAEKNEESLHDARKARWEERLEQGRIEADQAQRNFEEEMERQEERARLLGLDRTGLTLPPIDLTAILDEIAEADGSYLSIFEQALSGWIAFYEQVLADAPTLNDTLQSLGDIAGNAFEGMANAIGNVVQQWVLYGETGPAIMRKILASALATIAAEAAVRAIYELALGFAALFFNPAEAAAHFTAAALFGAVAAAAGLAGRAVAGDSFKKQSNTATGRSDSRSGSSASRSTAGQGGAYSSHGDKAYVHEESRSAPLGVAVQISFKDKPSWFDQMFETRWLANGKVRRLVEDGR
jgi:hypothetical protein